MFYQENNATYVKYIDATKFTDLGTITVNIGLLDANQLN